MKAIFTRASALLLLLFAACAGKAQTGGTFVWIDAPLDNSTLANMATIKIEGHASSPDGVKRVEIMVNGERITTLNDPPNAGNLASYETTWTPSAPGDYLIHAVAYGVNGSASQLDSARVRFTGGADLATPLESVPNTVTPSPEISITPTLTSTATRTASPVPSTPTLTSLPEAVIQFWADPQTIKAGQCTTFYWHAENVQRVVFGGIDQPLDGTAQDCLCTNQVYPLTVVHLDGREKRSTIEVQVKGSCATEVPPDTTPPPAPSPAVPQNGLTIACHASQALVWLPVKDPSGISGYDVEVQRSMNKSKWTAAPGSRITGVNGKTTTISIECGWIYRWRVRAVDGKGNAGSWSSWSEFSIPLS